MKLSLWKSSYVELCRKEDLNDLTCYVVKTVSDIERILDKYLAKNK